jgi:hypothetical protein
MDKFADYPTSLTAPARDGLQVTPDDVTDLPVLPRAIYVGSGGDLSVRMAGGQSIAFQNIPAGSFLPIRAQRVNLTGTTATGLLAIW